MDLNNNNELNDVNIGGLAIAEGITNNEAGAGNNAAETLVVPEDDPIAEFFNESGLTRAVVLFAGVQGAGKIRRTSKKSWDVFGGDWNKLLSVAYPHLVQTLGLGALEAGPSRDYLQRLTTNAPLEATSPKSLSNYRFEVRLKVFGEEYLTFVPGTFDQFLGLSIPLPDALGTLLVEEAPDEKSVIPVDIVVRVFDTTTNKFATLAKTETMKVVHKYMKKFPWLSMEGKHEAIRNFLFDVNDPDVDTWVPVFWTTTTIHYNSGNPFLAVFFIQNDDETFDHPTLILDLMEKLEWM